MDHGQFSGEPVTIWRTQSEPDRQMEMVEDFTFTRGATVWPADKGTIIDGASIPQPLWSLVGSPYTGDYRRASIVHDVACVTAGTDHAKRRAADRMFYHACRAGGCGVRQSILLYVGVRIGAWWNEHRPRSQDPAVKLCEDDESSDLREDYEEVGKQVLDDLDSETDDIELIEARTDEAMMRRGLVPPG